MTMATARVTTTAIKRICHMSTSFSFRDRPRGKVVSKTDNSHLDPLLPFTIMIILMKYRFHNNDYINEISLSQ